MPAKKKPVKKKKTTKKKTASPYDVKAAKDKAILKSLRGKVFQGVSVTRLVSLFYKVYPPTFTHLTPIKRAFAELMLNNLCNVTAACRQTGITRQTYYNWCEDDKDFAAAMTEAKESQIDFVENKLMTNVQQGKETSAIFFLKTIGRERGYIETHKIDVGFQAHQQALQELEALGLDKIMEMIIRERNIVQIGEGDNNNP